jgi:hypothetical protein
MLLVPPLFLLFVSGLGTAVARASSAADVSLVECTQDRIILEARFGFDERPLSPREKDCYLAFPARQYELTARDVAVAKYDADNRLVRDGYIPSDEELPPAKLNAIVHASTGFCHDRVIARLQFDRKILREPRSPYSGVFNVRSMRIVIQFQGDIIPGFRAVPAGTATDSLGYDPLFRALLLNYPSSLGFRVREEFHDESRRGFYDAVGRAAEEAGVWKFSTTGAGVHRVEGKTLTAAGIAGHTKDSVQLWCEGEEVPYWWSGPDSGTVSGEDSLYFYEERAGTDYSKERPWWITVGAGDRTRPVPLPAGCPSPATAMTAFDQSQDIGRKNVMPLREARFVGIWFRDVIVGNRPHTYSFDLPAATGEKVDFHIVLRNALPERLVVVARVEGASAASLSVDPFRSRNHSQTLDFSFPLDGLHATGNELSLEITNEHRGPAAGTWEGLYVEEMRITHRRLPTAVDGRLRLGFPAEATGCAVTSVTGFSGGDVVAFQIASEFRPVTGLPVDPAAGVTLPVDGGDVFEFLEPQRALTVEELTPFPGLDLRRKSNRVNYVFISSPEFLNDLAEFASSREELGYRVRIVDIRKVYDEFSCGVPDPHAVRRFIRYALDEWEYPAPSTILLVGDASWDYANRTNSSFPNLVPTYLPLDRLNSAGSDVWFARAVAIPAEKGVDPPDVFLARLPVRTLEELRLVTGKVAAYERESEPGPWRARALLAADHEYEGMPGEVLENAMPLWISPSSFEYRDFPLEDYYRIQMLRPDSKATTKKGPEATRDLVRRINEGALLWDYFGHGGAYVLSKSALFIGNERYDSDVKRLHNRGRLPFFTSLSCYTGYFYLNSQWSYSLGESLVLNPAGAIGTLTPTYLGSRAGEERLSELLKEGFFRIPKARIGEAVGYAQIAGTLENFGGMDSVVSQFVLFADPAVRLLRPGSAMEIHPVRQEDVPEGRAVTYQWPANIVDEGSLSISLHNAGRQELLWSAEMPLALGPEGTLDLTLPGVGPEQEPILNLYGWNAETGTDFAGGGVLPSLHPFIRFVPDKAVLETEAGVLKGYVTIKNETARREDGLTLSLLLGEEPALEETLPALEPGEERFHPIEIPVPKGQHHVVVSIIQGDRILAVDSFSVVVPEPGRPPVPIFSSGGISVKLLPDALGRAMAGRGILVPGADARIDVRVLNPSLETTETLDCVFSTDDTAQFSRVEIPALDPGRGFTASADWVVPGPGNHSIRVELVPSIPADATPAARTGKSVEVGGYPDLVVPPGGIVTEPPHPVEGESVRFRIPFRNDGENPAAGFAVRVYEIGETGTENELRQAAEGIHSFDWPRFDGVLEPGESGEFQFL